MSDEQRAQLAALVSAAQRDTRQADDMVHGALYRHTDPELRGHLAIALAHLQAAEGMLAHMAQEATNG